MAAEVVVYGTRYCPYCVRAKMLLGRKGVAFREIDVGNGEARRALQQQTGSRLVPQIFINGALIGGFDELADLDHDGQLDPLLAQPPTGTAAPT